MIEPDVIVDSEGMLSWPGDASPSRYRPYIWMSDGDSDAHVANYRAIMKSERRARLVENENLWHRVFCLEMGWAVFSTINE